MKLITHYVLRNMSLHRARNIGVFLAYLVITIFFAAELSMLDDFRISNETALDGIFGTHDGIFCTETPNVEHYGDFEETGVIAVAFNGTKDNESTDRLIIAGNADDTAVSHCSITAVEGRLPQTENEIALERSLHDILYPNSAVGDKITININSPEKSQAVFSLCGIVNDFSGYQWDSSGNMPEMPNAFVGGECVDAMYYFVSVKGNVTGTDGAVFLPNQRNSLDVMNSMFGISSDNSVAILNVVLIVFVLISFLAVLFVFSRMTGKELGVLRSAGFDEKSVSAISVIRLCLLIVPALIFGAVGGCAITMFRAGMVHCISIIKLAAFVVFSVVILCAVEIYWVKKGFRRPVNCELRKCPPKTGMKVTSSDPIWLYSLRCYIMNGQEISACAVTTFLAVMLLFIAVSVNAQMRSTILQMERPYDMSVLFTDQTVTTLNVSRYNSGLSEQEFQALKNRGADVIGIKRQYVYELGVSDGSGDIYSDSHNDDIKQDMERLGFSDQDIFALRINGLDDDSMNYISGHIIDGEIDRIGLQTGTQAIWVSSGGAYEHSVGDVIQLGFVVNSDPDAPSYDKMKYYEINVTICAVAEFSFDSPDRKTRALSDCIEGGLIWSDKAFENIGIQKGYDAVYLWLPEDSTAVYRLINDFKSHYGSLFHTTDYIQEQQVRTEITSQIEMVSVVFISGIAAVSLISFAIVTASRAAQRRKVYGYLRAAGLTGGQLFRLLSAENGISIAVSFLSGAVLGWLLVWVLQIPMSGGWLIAVMAAGYAVVTACVGAVIAYRICRVSIAECIR